MPRQTGVFVHERLVKSLKTAGHFRSLCTISELSEGRNAVGERVKNLVVVHQDIPCQIGQPRSGMFGTELDQASSQYYTADWIAYLDRHLPNIDETFVATVDGKVYDIKGIGHAVNDGFTWLALNERD